MNAWIDRLLDLGLDAAAACWLVEQNLFFVFDAEHGDGFIAGFRDTHGCGSGFAYYSINIVNCAGGGYGAGRSYGDVYGGGGRYESYGVCTTLCRSVAQTRGGQ